MNPHKIVIGLLLLALVPLAACSQPPRSATLPNYGATALAQTMAINHYWALVAPPLRPYAANLSPSMGGPLATNGATFTPGGAGELGQIDDVATLTAWYNLGYFPSRSECEIQRGKNLTQARDPKWIAEEAAKLQFARQGLLLDTTLLYEAMVKSKCVSAAELVQK